MLSFARFILGRILSALLTLVVITMILYGVVMMTPPETRAMLFASGNLDRLSEAQLQQYIQHIIERNHLNDPYPVQYLLWVSTLVRGEWGFSPTLNTSVLDALALRTPITAELTFYSLLFLIPLGLVSGAIAGWNRNRRADNAFRASAFVAASLPNFVLAIVLISIFYVGLHWFPPGRLGDEASRIINSQNYHAYTGFLTIDGLLNWQLAVTVDAFRHLILPVLTLSLIHWATLGRIVRASMIDEMQKEYILAAKSRGLPDATILWRHPFPNTIPPALASSALAAAALVTGVFVVERIYTLRGVSDMVMSLLVIPDAAAALGFAVYNVILVLLIMLVLDILRGVVDPRAREGWAAR